MNLALIFGGKSAEHEVSLRSAKNIYSALDKDKFSPVLIGITKRGGWFYFDRIPEREVKNNGRRVSLIPGSDEWLSVNGKKMDVEVVFPILHGPNGEDGTIQGLLKLLDVPFVGADSLSSAVAMDKEVSKILLQNKGLKVADWITFKREADIEKIENRFDYPLFVKPSNLGSSVGVSKVKNKRQLKKAIDLAFTYDEKILIEEFIDGKELECSVLGNKDPQASPIGEIKPKDKFYSYEEKYSDESKTELIVPAEINSDLEREIQKKAVKAFKSNMCTGMARVDFLVTDEEIYVNELNTIPGFTKISMYPKLWQEENLSYRGLISRLIELAIEEHEDSKKLKNDH